MAIRSFAAGDIIYKEGMLCENIFIILSGEVNISSNNSNNSSYNLKSGEIFGESNILKYSIKDETATAITNVELQVLSEEHIELLISESPVEIQKIIKKIVSHNLIKNEIADNKTYGKSQEESINVASNVDINPKIMENIDRITTLLENIYAKTKDDDDSQTSPAHIHFNEEMLAYLSDLGPIMPLINDDDINDILINGYDRIFVEKNGILEKTNVSFKNDREILNIAEKIVKAIGRKIDYKRPIVDARLLDGSRVNIVAPPLAIDGTTISIRKFAKKGITLDKMIENNNISPELGEFLKIIGKCRINTIISGGTGSGKTTMLNAISQHIDDNERIVTIEDAAELQLQQPHVVRLETNPYHSGIKREEEVTVRDLVKNALRMRPDRIIVGEVRGAESFDMMQAMNSGHDGSLTTIHANHPRDTLSRIENMISMADIHIPQKSLRYQLASALHIIIQISRMRDGKRRITHVSEIVGMEGDVITMHDLFNYTATGEDENGVIIGKFKWSGIVPRFTKRISYYGELKHLEDALGVKFPKNIA